MMLPADRWRAIVLSRLTELGRIGSGARVSVELMREVLQEASPGTPLAKIYRGAVVRQQLRQRLEKRSEKGKDSDPSTGS
jgi:hypothetical protein